MNNCSPRTVSPSSAPAHALALVALLVLAQLRRQRVSEAIVRLRWMVGVSRGRCNNVNGKCSNKSTSRSSNIVCASYRTPCRTCRSRTSWSGWRRARGARGWRGRRERRRPCGTWRMRRGGRPAHILWLLLLLLFLKKILNFRSYCWPQLIVTP